MAVAATVWLGYEFWRLLWQTGHWGAIDLRILHTWVNNWFAGVPLYGEVKSAMYPPATYAILWPLMGWLAFTPARWLWAITTVIALGWLSYLVVRHSLAESPSERTAALLMPLSMYATGAAIGNGQLIVHIMPLLVAGLVLLNQQQRGWRLDLLAAALVLVTFVKTSIAAPFFWIVRFVPGSLRPASLVALGYLGLTLFSVSFQDASIITLLRDWLGHSSARAVIEGHGNVSNLSVWLGTLGLHEWILPTSLLLLIALGVWTYHHRRVDLWLLLGVTAYVARFWTYHRWYDDLLILLPMIALFRLAKQRATTEGADGVAGILLTITMLVVLAPGGLFLFPPPWNMRYVAGQVIVWIIGLVFLLAQAWRKKGALVPA